MSVERTTYNWTQHKEGPEKAVRQPAEKIEIDDETWRDGMQGTQSPQHPSTEQKALYISKVAELGYVDNLDIGFPASGHTHRQEITELINFSIREQHGLTFSAAGRGAVIGDVKSIIEVAQRTGVQLRADLFLDPSTSRANVEKWNRKEKLEQTMLNIAAARREGLPVMFVPERASVTSPKELFEACIMAADAGVDRIAIADTAGVLDPIGTQNLFREVFERVGKRFPEIKFDFHEHDDLGMGTANCIVAAMEGVDGLHATARGVGERAGNVKLEELLVVLDIKGLREIDSSHIQEFAKMAAHILGLPINSHEPIVGERSTETASGVHASTYEKVRKGEDLPPIYFAFDPKSVGLRPRVRIGPMSGLANVYSVLNELKIEDITEEQARNILNIAKEGWRILSDQDVKDIVAKKNKLNNL